MSQICSAANSIFATKRGEALYEITEIIGEFIIISVIILFPRKIRVSKAINMA